MAKRGKKIPEKLARRAKQIQVLLMDVDGTLTDGSVALLSQSDGSALEIKTFDAHDGQGLTLAVTAGIRTGVITGRASAALRRRCKELDIEFVYEKQGHKIAAYEDVLRKTGAKESEVAFLGDDLPDLTVMNRVGLAVAVHNATPEVRRAAPLHHQSRWRQRRRARTRRSHPQIQRHLGRNDRQGPRLNVRLLPRFSGSARRRTSCPTADKAITNLS